MLVRDIRDFLISKPTVCIFALFPFFSWSWVLDFFRHIDACYVQWRYKGIYQVPLFVWNDF